MTRVQPQTQRASWVPCVLGLLLIGFPLLACEGSGAGRPLLTADMPLHLEEHLDAATITGSKAPEDIPEPVTWHFDEPQPEWRPFALNLAGMEAVRPVPTDDALRLPLTEANRIPDSPDMAGVIYIALPDWSLEDWAYVEVRARTRDLVGNIALGLNYTEEDPVQPGVPLQYLGPFLPAIPDNTIQTYQLMLDMHRTQIGEGPWTHLAVGFQGGADTTAVTLDILSISIVPVEALYGGLEAGSPQPIEWRFDEPQPGWKAPEHFNPTIPALLLEQTDDALRVGFDERHEDPRPDLPLHGDIHVDLPDLRLEDWSHVLIRARASEGIRDINICFNMNDPALANDLSLGMAMGCGERIPIIDDGTIQTYRLGTEWNETLDGEWEGPWRQLVHTINAVQPANLDILSVTLVSKAQVYAEAAVGLREISVGNRIRRSVYTHLPSRLEYRVQVPEGGRLDVGLGLLRRDAPVTFRVQVQPPGEAPATLLEESYSDSESWGQRSIDLAGYAGHAVTLALEADAVTAGTTVFWGAPTVSGSTRAAEKPNVVFYVIDGAGAEYMSLYGYNRRTTPNIDRLATEGAVFERAYSNSSWTRPSTASFMTSLQHSVLGGFDRGGFNVVPEGVLTLAQHFHRGGYQTGVFTPNPNAGKMSGLDREVDVFQEAWDDFTYGGSGHWREGSRYLHDAFWTWRGAFPGEPFWVHFQPVDVHSDFPEVAPFGGLFVGSEQLGTWQEWEEEGSGEGVWGTFSGYWEERDPDRIGFFTTAQGLYDEAMAHNDYQIGRLVERLKAEGEWENTLLIIAADHSIEAAMVDVAAAIQDSLPPAWSSVMFRPSISRVPLVFVWPGHIAGGQRFSEPVVSMIDVLPTVLDLVGLPLPEVMQGQSLAPLLLGEGEVESRPVILDEARVDRKTGEFRGLIEVIDGRWGASLEINPEPPEEDEPEEDAQWRRPVPLLLYDLWNDPYCFHSIHEERPDLVEKYTAFLEEQWEAHQNLGKYFTPSGDVVLTPQQLEALRALGYIR